MEKGLKLVPCGGGTDPTRICILGDTAALQQCCGQAGLRLCQTKVTFDERQWNLLLVIRIGDHEQSNSWLKNTARYVRDLAAKCDEGALSVIPVKRNMQTQSIRFSVADGANKPGQSGCVRRDSRTQPPAEDFQPVMQMALGGWRNIQHALVSIQGNGREPSLFEDRECSTNGARYEPGDVLLSICCVTKTDHW
ncbi:MAG: hypothetical protein KDK75_16695 [Alphaproteobacteria bacterium]|nr:hypothetical protein [Alphaproteobacteria bacterium]